MHPFRLDTAVPLLILSLFLSSLLPTTARAAEPSAAPRTSGTIWVDVLIDLSASMNTGAPHGEKRFEVMRRGVDALRKAIDEAAPLPAGCQLKVRVKTFFSVSTQVDAKRIEDCLPEDAQQSAMARVTTVSNWSAGTSSSWQVETLKPGSPETDTPLEPAFKAAMRDLRHPAGSRTTDARILIMASDGVPSCRRRETRGAAQGCGQPFCEFAQAELRSSFMKAWATSEPSICAVALDMSAAGTVRDSVLEEFVPNPGCTSYAYDKATVNRESFGALLAGAAGVACGAWRIKQVPCQPMQPLDEVVAVGGRGQYWCSGVVLAPQLVLTARHCLPASEVLAGESVTRPLARRAVAQILLPPDARVDAALLRLQAPLKLHLRPWRQKSPPLLGAGGVHVGFGSPSSEGTLGFGSKRIALVNLASAGCSPERALRNGCNPAFEWALTGSPGYDTCNGDSGGGLYEPAFTGERCLDANGQERFVHDWHLLGITSRSAAGSSAPCGAGGIYTRLDVLTPWLDEIIHSDGIK